MNDPSESTSVEGQGDRRTLVPYIDRYLAQRVKLNRMSRDAAKDARYSLFAFAEIHGGRPVNAVTPAIVERYLESIAQLAPASRRNYLSRVRRFCVWLVENGYLKRDPCLSVEPIKQPRQLARSLRDEDVAALLDTVPDLRAQVIVWLMVGCGLRCIEVARLQVADYDHRTRTLRIVGKGGHERMLPVPMEVVKVIEAYLAEENLHGGPIIRNRVQPGRGVSAKTLSLYMRRWLTEAGVKGRPWDGRSAHALRHTAATDVYERSADLRVVKDMLGHANIATTSRYIGTTNIKELREAMEGRTYRPPVSTVVDTAVSTTVD